ncbi:long-chain-fatty-acid--CoA ligase 1-like [Dysidea avara]|uniref:long-chain-fatty-acid--CoA ligase 1-like n=1 Tax=Dysidea avara TaxID=196820 RepID=UPI003321209D
MADFFTDPATLIGLGAVAAATAYYVATRPTPVKPPYPLENQSVELLGGSGERVSHLTKDGKLIEYMYEDTRTLYDGFQRGMRISGDGLCLGKREPPNGPYKFIKYSEVEDQFTAFGSGLIKLGIKPGQESFIGIYTKNCIEWVVTEQACSAYSMIVVPLYDTLGSEAVEYIINQTGIKAAVVATDKMKLLIGQASKCPTLKFVISISDSIPDDMAAMAKEANIELLTYDAVMDLGRQDSVDHQPASPDDICTICYTSGTTGMPKGVILTHGAIVSNVSAVNKHNEAAFVCTPDDVHISFLPLAHMMERAVQVMLYTCGAKIGFYSGDVKKLIDDVKELKPTLFIAVPRILYRIYDKVMLGVSQSAVKQFLFSRAMASKGRELDQGIVRRNSFWDTLVFRKIQDGLGGRVRLILTGSAPISKDVMRFTRCALGCAVIEGYGQTECVAGATMTLPYENTAGHVGAPLPSVMVKLVDVEDMNYFAANNEGEVCFKGPSVFKGYLKLEDKTREALDSDGWLHSGDIGRWLPNGALKIIDRKKSLIKLQQGEYVSPEKAEAVYLRSSLVEQAFVDGDSTKTYVVGIIVPDQEMLIPWAKSQSIEGTFSQLCKNETVKKAIMDDISKLGKEAKLFGFEQAKAIMLYDEPFSVENGLLTPTQKMKRPQLRHKFKDDIQEMYKHLP